jgi:hypothetical protein
VVQIGRHSGTLLNMPETVPANRIRLNDAAESVNGRDREEVLSVAKDVASEKTTKPAETGGPAGPEPTRYGDWERKGRCIDF